MAISEGFSVESDQGKSRPIPLAFAELIKLLAGGASAETILPIVAELEKGYRTVSEKLANADRVADDATTTLVGIRQLLSDDRLTSLGIHSKLALPPDTDN